MASRLPGGDIIVFHEYFDFVIRSKCGEFLNSPHAQAPLIINSCRLKKKGGGGRNEGAGMCWWWWWWWVGGPIPCKCADME